MSMDLVALRFWYSLAINFFGKVSVNIIRPVRDVRDVGALSCIYSVNHQWASSLCSNTAQQESGTNEEILEFAESFDAREKFTFFEKGSVNGKDAREVFSFLKQKLPSEDGSTDIRWNFTKFLVNHKGEPYKRSSPTIAPAIMKDDIEFLLKKKEAESTE